MGTSIPLPPALAGDDNEVSTDADGVVRILKLTAGVAAALGIVAAGAWVKERAANAAGAGSGGVNLQLGA